MNALVRLDLREQLAEVANELDRLARRVYEDLATRTDPYRALDTNGAPVLGPILTARANALAALVQLEHAAPQPGERVGDYLAQQCPATYPHPGHETRPPGQGPGHFCPGLART